MGALVTRITKEAVWVTLVNTNQVYPRTVVVQTGAYGEHQCEHVDVEGRTLPVGNRFFAVRLAPGAGTMLVVHRRRMANRPTLAFPWHGPHQLVMEPSDR